MIQAARPIVLVGCGKMGGALLSGWRARGMAAEAAVAVEINPDLAEGVRRGQGIRVEAAPEALPADLAPAVILFAVKPQMMDGVAPAYRRFLRPDTLALSIAAGKTIATFHRYLGPEAAIVRCMPNTPAAVGRGITAAVANPKVTAAQRALADELLRAVGEVVWLTDETLIDPVTAVSGGAPAYVALLVEVLAKAGAKAGLPAEVAMQLARAGVAGSGELLFRSSEAASRLRENVTSPGGTTLEALKILMAENGLQPLFDAAVTAATRRGRELAG